MKRAMQSTRFWLIIFALLIMLSTAAMFFIKNTSGGTVAVISQDGAELQRIDLSSVKESYTIRIDSKDGGYNLLSVEPGRIMVLEASCPDKVCIHQSWISDSSRPIVCLPNKMMIVIEGGTDPNNIDGFTR